jgi:hypothetical protein
MSIPSDELAELVGLTKTGAAPAEAERLQTTIDTIRRANVTARLDSSQSRFLRNLTDKHAHFMSSDAVDLLRTTDLYGTDLAIANAIPRHRNGRRQIILFEGLCHLIRYYADLITVLNLIQTLRPTATIIVEGEPQPEVSALSSAGFAIIADFIESGRTVRTLSPLLGPKSRRNAAIGYLGAVLFILLHELGHLQLGHLAGARDRTERLPLALPIDETIDHYQQQEFDADAFAFRSLRDEVREDFISSVLFFLGPFAFLEAFALPDAKTHPLSVNRAAHLASLLGPDGRAAHAVARIVESQAAGIKNLARSRNENRGDVRHRIREKMPLDLANRIVREVADRIRDEVGCLDTP